MAGHYYAGRRFCSLGDIRIGCICVLSNWDAEKRLEAKELCYLSLYEKGFFATT